MELFAATVGLVAAHIILTQTSPQNTQSAVQAKSKCRVFIKYMLYLSKVEKNGTVLSKVS